MGDSRDELVEDHVRPIPFFDVSKDEKLNEALNWKNNQPLRKQTLQPKGTKVHFLDYRLQFIKAYQFIKPNEESLNSDIHRSNLLFST